jgi:F420-dependent oxidoreductase-like protein
VTEPLRLSFLTRPQNTGWGALVDFWREGDRVERFDAGWTYDHFYPMAGGRTVGDVAGGEPVYEGWTMLAAMSQVVARLRFGVLVTANTFRHPAVLANMAATLDVISGGRLEIGLGAGWAEQEHVAYDIDLPPPKERFDRLEETCEILHLLLTREVTDFDGPFHRLRAARCDPKPIQRPRPPIVVGGVGEKRTLRIAARWADQWNLPGGDPDLLRRKIAVLHRHCADVGRDPADIEVSVKVRADTNPGALADLIAGHHAAGAGHVIVQFDAPFDPADLGRIAAGLPAG